MQIYFTRHGAAEDAGPGMTDAERRLTPEGVARMQAEAQALKRLKLKVDVILTSPLPRAAETARIVAKALGVDNLHEDERLAGGFGLGDLQAMVAERPGVQRLMLVGHNPDLPVVAGRLVGGAVIELKKGGVIRVDADRIEPGAGILHWVLPPSVLGA